MSRIPTKPWLLLVISGCIVLAFILKIRNDFIDQFMETRQQDRREFISIKTDLQEMRFRLSRIQNKLLTKINDTNVLKMKMNKEKIIENYNKEINLKLGNKYEELHPMQIETKKLEKKLLSMMQNIEKRQNVMVSLIKEKNQDISKHLRQLNDDKTKHSSLPHKGETLESIQFKELPRNN